MDLHEHDRHGAGHLLQRPHGRPAIGQDDLRRKRDQFRRIPANAIEVACTPTVVDLHVATVNPPQLRKPLSERRDESPGFRIVLGEVHEHADAPHPSRPLRPRCKRPRGRRSAEKRDEIASSELIE